MTRLARSFLLALSGAFLGLASCSPHGGSGAGAGDPPPEFASLEDGFTAEKVAGSLPNPVKLAFTPDGRLLFNELQTGRIRVIDAGGNLIAKPFATIDIVVGGERGLLGLAVSPDFDSDGFIFVVACVDGPPRQQVIRLRADGNVAAEQTVIVDDLPQGMRHNGGDLLFLPDGTFLVSVGDTGDSSFAQTDGRLAGRILRFAADGSIPADNPTPGDPEWARGIRNTFDMTLHPVTGAVFGVENGPDSDDELNLLAAGKNFEWPARPNGLPDETVGERLHAWTPVIAPTGVVVHDGRSFGSEYAGDVFVASWITQEVLRLEASDDASTQIVEESVFAALVIHAGNSDNKLLDLVEGPDGNLYLSTYAAIWRIRRR